MSDELSKDIGIQFQRPAIYRIKINGELDERFIERLQGMQVHVDRSDALQPVSILVGHMRDQSALMGVLTTLFENHLTILSVNAMEDI